jgi:hypothetical protein
MIFAAAMDYRLWPFPSAFLRCFFNVQAARAWSESFDNVNVAH